MTTKRDQKFVWVTWLSKLMSGENTCEFSPWFKTNYTKYKKAPIDFNLAKWQVDHTKMLHELKNELVGKGKIVYKEAQNQFRHKTKSGLVISGRPDLTSRLDDITLGIFDCKTGQERSSDQIQVMLYMHYFSSKPEYQELKPKGFVIYKENRIELPNDTIDEDFTKNIYYFLDILNSGKALLKSPSEYECKFCDITNEDCSERIERGK